MLIPIDRKNYIVILEDRVRRKKLDLMSAYYDVIALIMQEMRKKKTFVFFRKYENKLLSDMYDSSLLRGDHTGLENTILYRVYSENGASFPVIEAQFKYREKRKAVTDEERKIDLLKSLTKTPTIYLTEEEFATPSEVFYVGLEEEIYGY